MERKLAAESDGASCFVVVSMCAELQAVKGDITLPAILGHLKLHCL